LNIHFQCRRNMGFTKVLFLFTVYLLVCSFGKESVAVFPLTNADERDISSVLVFPPTTNQDERDISSDNVVCATDVFECPDGTYATRNPNDNCEFYPCSDCTDTNGDGLITVALNAIGADGFYNGCSDAIVGMGGNQSCELTIYQTLAALQIPEEMIIQDIFNNDTAHVLQWHLRDLCCESCAGVVEIEFCNEGCFNNVIADGTCDLACNVSLCQYDGGDCDVEEELENWVLLDNIYMQCPTGTIDGSSDTATKCQLVCESDTFCNFISFNDQHSICYLCSDMPTVECSACVVKRLDRDNCLESFIESNERVVFYGSIDHGNQELIQCSDYTNHDDGWYGSVSIGCQDGEIVFQEGGCHHWKTLIHSGSKICSNANEILNVNHIRECREHCLNDENCDHITYADNEINKICILCDQVPDQDSSYYCSEGSCEVQELTTKWNKQFYNTMDSMTCSSISATSALNVEQCQQSCYSNSDCHHAIFSNSENSLGNCTICSLESSDQMTCQSDCVSYTFDKTLCGDDEDCDGTSYCFNRQCHLRSTEHQPCDKFGARYPKCVESFICADESEENELQTCQSFDPNARDECYARNNVPGQTQKFVWCEPKLQCILWTDVCIDTHHVDTGPFAEQYFMIMLPILALVIMRVVCMN